MSKTKIMLSTIADVRDFVNKVVLVEYDVDLIQGRYVIDAKSIMGIFSLDLLSPIELVAHTSNADAFFEELAPYLAK